MYISHAFCSELTLLISYDRARKGNPQGAEVEEEDEGKEKCRGEKLRVQVS